MNISKEEVRYVAKLARLDIGDKEVENMTGQLDKILGYVAKLNELDTGPVEPTTHALSISNAFRNDVVRESLRQEDALANGPVHNEDAFVVPRVI